MHPIIGDRKVVAEQQKLLEFYKNEKLNRLWEEKVFIIEIKNTHQLREHAY